LCFLFVCDGELGFVKVDAGVGARCILFFFSFKRDSLAEVAGNWDLCHQQILGTCEVVSDLRNSFEFVVACVFSCKNPYALH
jgi:hypothetical protein